ncbi:coiled-coil domain-containing protein 81 [Gracilinanus agilis]|uniref:coiled-coil domain-containing protein 81 n=1 Tax=Gracilinanus agilis TaxID=191870 RepID=UPI001CFE789B|nr:coiled-coil domain-containing protein 81 [Gracilinanus agilis]
MLDSIHPALLEIGRQVFPTLPSLSQDEVSNIWANVSEFVERQLSLRKGVQIPGFGTFTFIRQRLDVGNNKFILLQRPVFVMAEKFAQMHGLRQNKVFTPGDIPVVQLNFVMISLEGPFNRDVVEGCVKETLLFLSRSISIKQNVEFTFKGIGVLMIRDSKVKMRFYKDFLCAMDGSGNLVKALSNRPGTTDSVISNREGTSARPCSVFAFPRIEPKDGETKPPIETIREVDSPGPVEPKSKEPGEKEEVRESISAKRLRARQAISPVKVTGINLIDRVEKNNGIKTPGPERIKSPSSPKPSEADLKPKTPVVPLCQGHVKAGQEMCYVCLQRSQRNVPVYYNEEKKRKEIEDDRIIQQYQVLKDQEALYRHQAKNMAIREQNQKNAAYNLGVAEAIRSHKIEKPEYYRSFIFDKRPHSPEINSAKQEEYSQGLLKQMESRREKEMKQKQNAELMDRLEQVQLTEDLAAQRSKYLKDRMEEAQYYKRALDVQIKNRPPPLPMYEPDSSEPIFGKMDMSNQLMLERKQREQKYMKHQMQSVADHKRTAILRQLVDQRRDVEMLQKTQREHLAERMAELERAMKMNQGLQENWEKSAELKRHRDMEEKIFKRASDKLFILDQCEKYRRCCQCKRRLNNCGETNLWPMTKHLHGSRLLV